MFTNPPYSYHTGCGRNSQISPSISCTFEFDRSTPWTFYPPPPHTSTYPTFSVHYHSLANYFLLYMPFLLHSHSSPHLLFLVFPYLPFCSPPIYPLTRRILGLLHPPANILLQTCTREYVLLEIFATARDSFPFVASTAPGQDPVGSGSVIFFLSYSRVVLPSLLPPHRCEAMARLFLACLVRVK